MRGKRRWEVKEGERQTEMRGERRWEVSGDERRKEMRGERRCEAGGDERRKEMRGKRRWEAKGDERRKEMRGKRRWEARGDEKREEMKNYARSLLRGLPMSSLKMVSHLDKIFFRVQEFIRFGLTLHKFSRQSTSVSTQGIGTDNLLRLLLFIIIFYCDKQWNNV